MASKVPKIKNRTASQAIGVDSLPVYIGPGLNFFWPQTTRQKMGVPQARLFPATASENSADAAAGAIRHNKPRTAANTAHPTVVRTGIYPNVFDMGRKKLENGKAPSREKAQD